MFTGLEVQTFDVWQQTHGFVEVRLLLSCQDSPYHSQSEVRRIEGLLRSHGL